MTTIRYSKKKKRFEAIQSYEHRDLFIKYHWVLDKPERAWCTSDWKRLYEILMNEDEILEKITVEDEIFGLLEEMSSRPHSVAVDFETIPQQKFIDRLLSDEKIIGRICKKEELERTDSEGILKIVERTCATDGDYGQLVSFSTTDDHYTQTCFTVNDMPNKSEKELILKLFEVLEPFCLYVTFNGFGFDWPFLMRRCLHLGIKPVKRYKSLRYKFNPGFDIAQYLTDWGRRRMKSQDLYCEIFDISLGDVPVSGAIVFQLVKEGKWDLLKAYNLLDTNKCMSLYKKIQEFDPNFQWHQ